MTVIAILASLLAPSFIRQIQSATAAGEDQNLSTISQGIMEYIKLNQALPDTNNASTNWAGQVSAFTSLSPDKILYVFPGQSSSRRMLVYDPALLAWGSLQTNVWSTSSKPNPARIMLVSSSSPDTDLTVTNITSTDFTNLFNWNKSYSNGVIVGPTGLPAAWQKKGEFLHVKTIDLGPYFCQVGFRDCYAPIANITSFNPGTGYTNSQFIFTNQNSTYQVNCDTNTGTVVSIALISAAGFNNLETYTSNNLIPPGTGSFINQPPPRGAISFNTNAVAPMSAQITTNIVLKGTKLYLQGSQAFEIQMDSEFEFFNQVWTQRY